MPEPLAPSADAPGWFRRALAVSFEDGQVAVDGAVIHYLAWGARGRRGLVFVHGDSDHRELYALEQWTSEVVAAADNAGIEGQPVVIGHSMGGFVTVATAALHGDRLAGVIICDSPVSEPDPEVESFRLKEAFGRPRTYDSVDEALVRFRTVPPQDFYLDYVIDHVARRSLKRVGDGWQWKFDRHIFEQFGGGLRSVALPYLERVRCRFALLRS